jgi:hypothetical protein
MHLNSIIIKERQDVKAKAKENKTIGDANHKLG